ncbi:hypothetical protein HOB30_05515 [Candidatus Falkowbacteria bacterium]|nr:hypothetical protein [Candidatus Falkowbacteria bacterium]
MSTSALSANYCTAIRGNGELAPTHWSALSKIVEHKGMPKTVSGGSSAAITMFLLDGLSRNKNLSQDLESKKIEQALLIKSFVPHMLYTYSEDANASGVMQFVGDVMGIGKKSGLIPKLKEALKIAKNVPMFFAILGEYGPLLNPEIAIGLKKNFSFYKQQISEGIKVFGGFDALSDKNIFYRTGIIDFKYLGVLFGRIADFYAGYADDRVNEKIKMFLEECRDVSVGKQWREILMTKPVCHKLFNDSLNAYYTNTVIEKQNLRGHSKMRQPTFKVVRAPKFPNKMIFEKVGSGLNSLPTTSLIVGKAVDRYTESLNNYAKLEAKNTGDFVVDYDTELKYGYWGSDEALEVVKLNLEDQFPNDLKSQKFSALHGGSWFEVIGTSPAEPGLSNLQRIADGSKLKKNNVLSKKYFYKKWFFMPTLNAIAWFGEDDDNSGVVPFREGMLSAGGWNDLHPTLVLKASGCEDILYLTRQDGESVFGQQIFIRLTGYTDKISFWKEISKNNRSGWRDLSAEEENSPWNRLYNLANPSSSFNISIKQASAVYCTDWNKYNMFDPAQIEPALADAWNAPVFVNDEDLADEYDFGYASKGKSKDNFPGCKPYLE